MNLARRLSARNEPDLLREFVMNFSLSCISILWVPLTCLEAFDFNNVYLVTGEENFLSKLKIKIDLLILSCI